jgi:hypothetical protein
MTYSTFITYTHAVTRCFCLLLDPSQKRCPGNANASAAGNPDGRNGPFLHQAVRQSARTTQEVGDLSTAQEKRLSLRPFEHVVHLSHFRRLCISWQLCILCFEMFENFQLANFTDEHGNLGRPVPAGRIVVPGEIWLKDDCVHWRMGKNPQAREASRSMLNQFIRLTDAASVLRFAQEWGTLALSGNLWTGPDADGFFYLPGRQSLKEGVEPVLAWQYYSKRARAVLAVAAALKLGKLGDMSDWGEFAVLLSEPSQLEKVFEWLEANVARHHFGLGITVVVGYGDNDERLENARGSIAGEIGGWLDCWKHKGAEEPPDTGRRVSDFALRWIEGEQRWDLQIDYHGLLFPAIALQLALVVAEADSLYTCTGCGVPYIRPRGRKRPKSGWANYCDQCSKDGVAQRRAVETYREKRAMAVRLHSGGTSISEIAEQLNAEVARVRKWLEKGGKREKTETRK